MGHKSKGNWIINLCLRFDCVYRNKLCDECINYSKYDVVAENKKEMEDAEN